MEVNYKSFYEWVSERYPSIVSNYTKTFEAVELDKLPEIIDLFCKISGISIENLRENKSGSFEMFLVVANKLFDPLYYHKKKYSKHGLVTKIAETLNLTKASVKYYQKKCKERFIFNESLLMKASEFAGKILNSISQ